jgi:hypothetical protein
VEWKTCKRQTDDRNWHRFGAGLGGSDAFVSRSLSEKLQIVICVQKYCSYLSTEREWHFMPSGHPRGLPDSVGSEDAWRVRSPSSGRLLPIWSMVLGDAAGAQFPEFTEDTCA